MWVFLYIFLPHTSLLHYLHFLEMSFSTAGAVTLLSHNSAVREPCDCGVWMDFPVAT